MTEQPASAVLQLPATAEYTFVKTKNQSEFQDTHDQDYAAKTEEVVASLEEIQKANDGVVKIVFRYAPSSLKDREPRSFLVSFLFSCLKHPDVLSVHSCQRGASKREYRGHSAGCTGGVDGLQ